ncbi:MAG: hypothetical protein GQ574_10185 [Crocinitomix sp.]|nr:hypothetical protein [Crocinitomix sp.]
MKNPLLYLKEKEHQHAFYAVAIFIMLSILFFLLVSLDSPVKKVVAEEPIETLVEVSFIESSSSGATSDAPNNANKEMVSTIAVQNEPSVRAEPSSSIQVDNAFNFNPSDGKVDGPAFGDTEGDDIIDLGPNEHGNANRAILKKPNFDSNMQVEGEIALKLWVDANGFVVKTMLDPNQSNSGSKYLIREAIKAAKTMRYNVKAGVPVEYVGTKIFSFKKA